jgi:hypothetical protein
MDRLSQNPLAFRRLGVARQRPLVAVEQAIDSGAMTDTTLASTLPEACGKQKSRKLSVIKKLAMAEDGTARATRKPDLWRTH